MSRTQTQVAKNEAKFLEHATVLSQKIHITSTIKPRLQDIPIPLVYLLPLPPRTSPCCQNVWLSPATCHGENDLVVQPPPSVRFSPSSTKMTRPTKKREGFGSNLSIIFTKEKKLLH